MRFSRILRGLLAFAAALSAGRAGAFLETGTLLTNSASATYRAGTEGTSLSYSATAKILIANPAMFVYKKAYPTAVGVVGGYVTFTISFSNGGANSAFNVTIWDRVPPGPVSFSSCSSTAYNAYVTGGGVITKFQYSLTGDPVDDLSWYDVCPAGPALGAQFFRWKISYVGIGSSGAVSMVMTITP